MKKSFKKFLMHTLSVALSTLMFASFSLNAISAESKVKKQYITVSAESAASMDPLNTPVQATSLLTKTEKQYVKDVVFIRADSKEEAKKHVPKGYIMDENDLNQGAAFVSAVDDVYLAYEVTNNPDEAITDIKMMNMKGGFVVSDYDTQIDKVGDNIKRMVKEFGNAVDAFRENYKKGTSGAKAAYRTLSVFTIPDPDFDNVTLADYFIYDEVLDGFLLKLILNAHTDVMAAILSALTMAVQGEPGNTWIDRLVKINNPDEITNSDYWDQSVALLPLFENFYEIYCSIDHDSFRGPGGPLYMPPDEEGNRGIDFSYIGTDPKVDNTGAEFYYELAHLVLEQYKFGNGTRVSDWLMCDYLYQEMLYPLIHVLTPAEYALMHLCGPLFMIFATAMNEDVYSDYIQRTNDIIKEMGQCSVWTGVNTDLLRSSIGITNEACRAIVETEAEQEFNNQGDGFATTALYGAGLLAASSLVALGTGMIVLHFLGSSLYAGLLGTAAVAVTSKAAVVASVAGAFCYSAGIIGIIIALVIAIIYLIVWVIDWIAGFYPDLTDIPEYMYDYVIDDEDNGQFLLYEVARDQNGKPVDVNAGDGKEWHAPYITRDKAAGAPIEADFKVNLGDGRLEEGYSALSAFGNINCENLNRYAFDDDVDGIFVSYRQQDLSGDYARGKYLAHAQLFTAENEEKCKIDIKNANLTLYNINLTPDAKYATYLGYKTTNREENALTDMRFAYNYSATPYTAGGGSLTYAASGTSGDLTLYTTRINAFGSPITSDIIVVHDRDDAPAGYEPINMFSGGSAVNLNVDGLKYIDENEPFYLYFLPSQVYLDGTEYIGGVVTMFDISWEGYFNGYGSVMDAAIDMGYKTFGTMKGDNDVEGALLFTTTYNPYRAIYDVGAMTNGGEMGTYFPETITYDGVGYILTTRYVVDYNDHILFDSTIRKNDARLYVAGVGHGGTPLKPGEISATSEKDRVLDSYGYVPVSAFLSGDGSAVDICKGFNYSYYYGYSLTKTMHMNMSPMYVYVRKPAYQEWKYISSVYIVNKEQVLGGKDISCGDVDSSYVMSTLAMQGAHTVVNKNLNLKDSSNATYLGYTKNSAARDPITDMFLYYAGDTDKEPEPDLKKDGIQYQLVSYANIFCPEDKENKKCKRVYLYTTTNPAAGTGILDIVIDNNPILDGWETVRTQNNKALYVDMDEHSGNMWFIHMKRLTETPKYISEIVIGWGNDAKAKAMLVEAGCDYMLTRDLNDGVGALSHYVYLGYKRTSDPNKAIRNIISVHNESYTTFTKDGAVYSRIDGNLNSYTHYFADDIYLFYTKDAKAGTPLTSLAISTSADNWSHGEGNRYVVTTVLNQDGKPSDLNNNCGYQSYYLYLLQTRDKQDQAVASMIGEGSVLLIVVFTAISACVIEWRYLVKKKRDQQELLEAGEQESEKKE